MDGEHCVISWATDPEGRCTHVDPCWSDFTGQSAEEALGYGWLTAIHPDDRDAINAEMKAMAERLSVRLEYRLRHIDGGYRRVISAGTPRYDSNGAFLGYIGTVLDVEERRAKEAALAESEALHRTLLSALADGVFVAQDYSFVFANPTLPAMLGYAQEEFDGLPFSAVVAPEDLPIWTERYEARIKEGPEPVKHYEICLVNKNGQRLETELSARRIRYKGRSAVLGVLRDVRERHRANAALRESEERFRQVVQSLPQLVWTCDAEGNCDYLSPQWVAYTGLPEEPQLGYGWLNQLHPDDRERTLGQWSAARERGDNVVIDYRLRRHDGKYRWFHTLAVPLKDRDQKIVKWFGSNTDITQIRDTEDALRESEQRFASFMRHLPGLAWIKDANGKYTFANEAAQAAFGRSLAEILGKTDTEIFDRDTAALFQGNDRQAIASDAGIVTVETLKQEDGIEHHSVVSKFAIKDARGSIKGTGGVAIDVTERIKAEETLAQQSRLIDLSFDPIFVWDWDRGIVTWNRGCEHLYGYTRAEALGKTSQDLLRTRFYASRTDFEAQLLNKGEWAGEVEHHAKDGREICVESRHQLIRVGGRKLVLEANRDITERKQAENALLQASNRKDVFLATLAHELRNPLGPIHNGVQLLKRVASDSGSTRDVALLAMMERQVTHLVKLVDDLLEISRIDQGKIELRKEPADVAFIVKTALETCQPQIDKGQHRIVMHAPDRPLRVSADALRLSQALTNLISNSAKFTPAGGQIEVETLEQDGQAVIKVRDNGRGIPAEALPHVFELFTQVDSRGRQEGGLGIGLALVRKIVELHGGAVEVHSEGAGKGSEFVISLPMIGAQPAIRPPAGETSVFSNHRCRVVVVDDDRDAADSLRMVLEAMGATVRVAYDGRAGAQLVLDFEPDVVFLDIGMPDFDGYQTARLIRQSEIGAKLTLVALTGWGQSEDRARTREAGFDVHLTKPASIEALEAVVSSASEQLVGE